MTEVSDRPLPGHDGLRRDPPTVDVVVPVYNEERILERSIRRLHAHLVTSFPMTFRVTIADNASTDATAAIADRLAVELPNVRSVHLPVKGRGHALREVWGTSDAAVLAYMDVDLSTDLAALLPLVAPLLSGHSDLAVGSRLTTGSRVVRGTKREVISRCYNLLLRTSLRARFRDAQCGFKAVRADRARTLLPLTEDTGWFFDTELLVLAERAGLRIHEVPVDWVDDPDSRVDVVATALADLRGIARLMRALLTGRLAEQLAAFGPGHRQATLFRQGRSFAAIGVLSTVAYLLLYVLLRIDLPAQVANVTALLATAVANTAANRRFTFGIRGPRAWWRHQGQGVAIFAVGLALSAGALGLLHRAAPHAGWPTELAVLIIANVVTTLVRFVALRSWVFAPTSPASRETAR